MLNDKNYLEILKGINVVFIEGDFCSSCVTTKNVLVKICKELDLNLIAVEASENIKEFIEKYDINHIPSILLFYNDELLGKTKGYQPEEILRIWLEAKKEERTR